MTRRVTMAVASSMLLVATGGRSKPGASASAQPISEADAGKIVDGVEAAG